MITPQGGNVFLYINTSYSYVDHDYDINFHVTMMLRSTTGPYRGHIWGDDTFTPPRLFGR